MVDGPTAPTAAIAPAPATKKATAAASTKATSTKKTKAKPKRKAKRKKPASSASSQRGGTTVSASNATAIWNAANAAQANLSKQKAKAAARQSDPLWYRVEEPLASVSVDSPMSGGGGGSASVMSDQVQLVERALANHNLTRIDITPQAFACLLEQARRFALELLADAQDYAHAGNRHEVSRADLLLASELRPSNNSTIMSLAALSPRLSHLAQQVNRTPLPPIPTSCFNGVQLPPQPHQLTARTFDVVSGAQTSQRMVAPPPALPSPTKKSSKKKSSSSSSKTSYGAKRGQLIPIQLKESTKNATAKATATPMDVVPDSTTTAVVTSSPTAPPGTTTPATAIPGVVPAQVVPAATMDGGTKRKAGEM